MSKPTRDKSLPEIALALGISEAMTRRYVSELGIPSDGSERRRRYSLDEFRKCLRDAGVQQTLSSRSKKVDLGDDAGDGDGGENGEEITLAEANRRLTLERERETRIKNDIREGKLVDAEEYKRRWMARVSVFKTAVDSVPQKAAAGIVSALMIPADKMQLVRDVVQRHIDDAKRTLTQ
jgi:hypothetical protein